MTKKVKTIERWDTWDKGVILTPSTILSHISFVGTKHAGLWSLMYTASSTSRWKWLRARATTEKRSNTWEHTAIRQSWLDLRWRVIAESERESANCLARTTCSSAGSDSTPPPRPALLNARPALIKVNGTCCLILSLNLWVVLPMYLRSHTQVKEDTCTKLLKVVKGKTSLFVVEKVEREEKQQNNFGAGKALEMIILWEIWLSNLVKQSPSHRNLRYIGHFLVWMCLLCEQVYWIGRLPLDCLFLLHVLAPVCTDNVMLT